MKYAIIIYTIEQIRKGRDSIFKNSRKKYLVLYKTLFNRARNIRATISSVDKFSVSFIHMLVKRNWKVNVKLLIIFHFVQLLNRKLCSKIFIYLFTWRLKKTLSSSVDKNLPKTEIESHLLLFFLFFINSFFFRNFLVYQ